MPYRFCLATLLACLVHSAVAAETTEPLAVIVSTTWDVEEITLPDLRRLYLGRTTQLADTRVICFHLRSGTESRDAFSLSVLGKSELEMTDYWIQQALTGGRIPPREVTSTEDMVRAVATRPGAIGYVPWSAVQGAAGEVRVLRVAFEGRAALPSDAGYPIRVRLATAAPHATTERGRAERAAE